MRGCRLWRDGGARGRWRWRRARVAPILPSRAGPPLGPSVALLDARGQALYGDAGDVAKERGEGRTVRQNAPGAMRDAASSARDAAAHGRTRRKRKAAASASWRAATRCALASASRAARKVERGLPRCQRRPGSRARRGNCCAAGGARDVGGHLEPALSARS